MIFRLVQSSYDDFTPPKGVTEYDTHHNHMPGPYWEIHPHEFYHYADIWSIRWTEFRQVKIPEYPHLASIRINWYHDRGLAHVFPNKWNSARPEDPPYAGIRSEIEQYGVHYKEPIRYFRIGCDHKFSGTTKEERIERGLPERLMMHDQIDICRECGTIWRYDTSG